MTLNKRKIKKFQKVSMWILFLCAMGWLFFASALSSSEEELLSGPALICLAGSFILAVLDMLAMLVLQILIETRIKGWKSTVWGLVKNVLIYLGIGTILIAGLTIFRKETFQIGLLYKILGFALIAGIGCYMGRFWTLKISDSQDTQKESHSS